MIVFVYIRGKFFSFENKVNLSYQKKKDPQQHHHVQKLLHGSFFHILYPSHTQWYVFKRMVFPFLFKHTYI